MNGDAVKHDAKSGNGNACSKTFTEKLVLTGDAGAKIPATYILTVDKGKTPEQDDFFKHYERAKARKWTTTTLTADHNAQWSAPEELVKMLDAVK